jgi:hypothetical protein
MQVRARSHAPVAPATHVHLASRCASLGYVIVQFRTALGTQLGAMQEGIRPRRDVEPAAGLREVRRQPGRDWDHRRAHLTEHRAADRVAGVVRFGWHGKGRAGIPVWCADRQAVADGD